MGNPMVTVDICLITPGHPSTNPRLVKEADTLTDAGFNVHVIAGDYHPWGHDADLQYQDRPWGLERVTYGQMAGSARRAYLSGRKRLASLLEPLVPTSSALKKRAHHWAIPELTRCATSVSADLYVAHYLPALPAAINAATIHSARVGFDAEDFHRGEFADDELNTQKARLTRWMEKTHLPACDYVTAASPGIGDAYAQLFDSPSPTPVLNTFPLSERSGNTPPEEMDCEHPGNGMSLYWYSQTIGPNRGLDLIVRAMGQAQRQVPDVRFILSLRGSWASDYEARLRRLAQSVGLDDGQIRHLSRVEPQQLIERAGEHDVGLALERPAHRSRDLCITNKILAYILAGLPVLASATQGQRYVHKQAPEAVALVPPDDPEAMAECLVTWACSPEALSRSAAAASRAGKNRFNWEVEQDTLLSEIRSVLDTGRRYG